MNQRILLPAIVIGTLFALLLTFVEAWMPAAGLLPQFLLNAVALCIALAAYGLLMQKATAAAQTTGDAPAAARSAPAGRQDDARRERAGRPAAARTPSSRAASGRAASGRAASGRAASGRAASDPEESARSTRPEPEAPAGPREQGHIKWFSGTKGFGFIIREDGSEIFVHHRAIRGQARGDLPDGQPVSFVVVERDKGPQADQVDLVDLVDMVDKATA